MHFFLNQKFEISPDGKLIAICGRLGEIHLLSSKTKEIIGTMKMNKKCRSLAFTPDSTKIISHGGKISTIPLCLKKNQFKSRFD